MLGRLPHQATQQVVIQVDAFTDRPFSGNPAAVCVSASPLDELLMIAYQASARGSVLYVECTPERVYISGQAVTVLRCDLLLF